MALIKFEVDTVAGKVDTDGILNLHPGDRLLFVASPPGQDIYVDLGDQLVALVKFKSNGVPQFAVGRVTEDDGTVHFTVKLVPPGGNDPPADPPD